ncbi:MAG: sulfate adenylyltransferase subunit CysD [Oceanospirillaceae bacterium]|nr:sulfate adenylyltransferase subunit CysD [Oceanospirillaceae bacterium]
MAGSIKHLSPEVLNKRRREAVQLRIDGFTVAEAARQTGLSAPTVIAAYKAFVAGGWAAVDVKPRGRKAGTGRSLDPEQERKLLQHLFAEPAEACLESGGLWQADGILEWVKAELGVTLTGRSLARLLQQWQLSAPEFKAELNAEPVSPARKRWHADLLKPLQSAVRKQGGSLLWGGMRRLVNPLDGKACYQLYVHAGRARQFWLLSEQPPLSELYREFFQRLLATFEGPVGLVFHGADFSRDASIQDWLISHAEQLRLLVIPAEAPVATRKRSNQHTQASRDASELPPGHTETLRTTMALTHLQRLEAESIHIMREVVAETENPVMLYSIGKDSAVMLHLAMKAFAPSVPPFPLLHVDTRWKFREMYRFRDQMAEKLGMDLLVHVNPEGVEKDVNPFTHGSAIHTDIMKTEGLKQALNKYGFDAAFGGARRDEEKSRAKERIFSFRSAQHRWDPKGQRPELWKLYNSRKHKGESIRVFPLSNWTELDIWQYIYLENIPIVPLYYAAERPVVERDGALIMVDDERMPLNPGEVPMMRKVRFRTLGCYPLTGAVESEADTLPAIIQEMLLTKTSERQGRVIDHDSAASMEKKKQEGYF